MKIYLSGPISKGDTLDVTERLKYVEVFSIHEERLVDLGHVVYNPCNVGTPPADMAPYQWYMRKDLPLVCKADVIAVLPEFYRSTGSLWECFVGHFMGIPIVPVEEITEGGEYSAWLVTNG